MNDENQTRQEKFSQEIISNVTAYYLVKHIWDGIPKEQKNDMAQEILDFLKGDPNVSNELLEAHKFYLEFKDKMPNIQSFNGFNIPNEYINQIPPMPS